MAVHAIRRLMLTLTIASSLMIALMMLLSLGKRLPSAQAASINSRILYVDPSIDEGLVAYWSLDGLDNVLVVDDTSNGNDGTLINAPIFTESEVASTTFTNYGARHFTAAAKVDVISPTLPTDDEHYSIALWVKPEAMVGELIIWGSLVNYQANIIQLGNGQIIHGGWFFRHCWQNRIWGRDA